MEACTLLEEFKYNKVSVFDTNKTEWQRRRREWIALGIKSEIGRENMHKAAYGAGIGDKFTGVSIFDPVLCELVYRWFVPAGGSILDPFAGGSVRGIVASMLGYRYTGIELRKEQIKANMEQVHSICTDVRYKPVYICGDSAKVLDIVNKRFDAVFSCPPYYNLEVYSDDPRDISNLQTYDDFIDIYAVIIKKALNLLRNASGEE